MKNLMKEAHKLTKEIKKEFPEVDYKTQLGICISYLAKESEEIEVEELKGWKLVEAKMNEAVKDLGVDDWRCNNWKKGGNDRDYLELVYVKGGHYRVIKCGFWDNIKEEYNNFDRYNKIYDIFQKEYVIKGR